MQNLAAALLDLLRAVAERSEGNWPGPTPGSARRGRTSADLARTLVGRAVVEAYRALNRLHGEVWLEEVREV